MKEMGVIFDFNGTLFWDTKLHNEAWDVFLEPYGFVMTDDKKHHRVHGRLNQEIIRDFFGESLTKDEVENKVVEKEAIYREMAVTSGLQLAEGAVELFELLIERGIPFGIATASGWENVEFFIEHLKLNQWFKPEHIIYNDGSVRGKPFPDLFEKAMDAIGLQPSSTVIFEDSVSGIQAARNAGVNKIIVMNSTDGDYQSYHDTCHVVTGFEQVDMDWLVG